MQFMNVKSTPKMNKLKIIGIFLLLPIIGYTQCIDKKEFNRLVDYVNCRYTKAYIESLRGNSISEADMEAYDKNIKSKIECSINKPIEYGELSNLLEDNKWSETNKNLSNIIDKNKDEFDTNLSSDNVISKLTNINKLSKTFQSELEDEQSELKKQLKDHIDSLKNKGKTNTPATGDSNNSATPTTEQPRKKTTVVKSGFYSFGLWALVILNVILTIVVSIYAWWSTRIKNRVKNDDSNELKINNINPLQKEIEKLKKDFLNKEEKVDELDMRIMAIENEIKALRSNIITNPPPVDPTVGGGKEGQIKYLKTAPQGVFLKEFESPNGCYFKLYDINDNSGKFKFCGDIHEAIANRSAIFDDTSEPFSIPQNITELITERPGIAIYQNGKWQVREKAIINFK